MVERRTSYRWPRRRLAVTLLLVGLAAALAGCGAGDRPDVGEWLPRWQGALAGIPAQVDLGSPPDQEVCGDTLGFVREVESGLLPAPDRALDDPVREWIEIAEDAFFECPPASADLPDFATAYAELALIEGEVASVLASVSGED